MPVIFRLRLIQLTQSMKNSGTVKTQVMTKAVHPEGIHILFPLGTSKKSIIDNISFSYSYTYDFLVT